MIIERIQRVAGHLQLLVSIIKLRISKKEQSRQKIREKISEHLAKSGGISMKIGQVVADVGQNSAFTQLLKGIPQRKLKDLKSQFSAYPDQPCLESFAHIDEKATAASLGQVHKGKLIDGELVAIKIQYPEIEQTIKSEFGLAGLMPNMGPAKRWKIDISGYKKTLKEDLYNELDYVSEARRQARFKKELLLDGLCIPKVFPSLCNRQVLVQSWEEGVYFDEVLEWKRLDQLIIARTLLMTLWKSIFVLGEVHGDPHMGNCYYRHSENGQPEVVLLDFGSTVNISETQRLALLKLILALRENTEISFMSCFSAMGFDTNKLAYIEHELPSLSRLLLKPFITDDPFDVNTWNVGRGFEVILQDRKWWFRSAGSSELLLLMRAFQGIVRQIAQLNAKLPWWMLLEKAVGKSVLQKAREFTLPPMKEYKCRPKLRTIATALNVKISDASETLMALTLPPDEALDLQYLIPAPVLDKLDSSQWNNESLQKKLRQTHLAPQVIYEKEIEGKNYKIWLA